jgi:hypothetical protein
MHSVTPSSANDTPLKQGGMHRTTTPSFVVLVVPKKDIKSWREILDQGRILDGGGNVQIWSYQVHGSDISEHKKASHNQNVASIFWTIRRC